MSDLFFRIALQATGVVGPKRFAALKNRFSDLSQVFGASAQTLSSLNGFSEKVAHKILSLTHPLKKAEELLERARKIGARPIPPEDPEYPEGFSFLPDPPFLLWKTGRQGGGELKTLCIVGSRNSTPYGRATARRLAKDAAGAGWIVVSGLARGIDAAAHLGALEAPGGKTSAFLGHGILTTYPSEHRELRRRIEENGALYSEYSPDASAKPLHFPQRNRLLAAYSRGVLVVEAAEKSGALHTVEFALELGKPVFAVPGPAHSTLSRGTHALLRDGAHLTLDIQDVFSVFGEEEGKTCRPSSQETLDLSAQERQILEAVSVEAKHIDRLVEETGWPVRKIQSLLFLLEMKGCVRQELGGFYTAVYQKSTRP